MVWSSSWELEAGSMALADGGLCTVFSGLFQGQTYAVGGAGGLCPTINQRVISHK